MYVSTGLTPILVWPMRSSLMSEVELRTSYRMKLKRSPKKTLLHLACSFGRVDLVEYLLSQGADPLVVDDQGWTPVCFFFC